MRITALGTGMPNQTKMAVSISYLVELGNGDKFLFDAGSGSLGNLFSLRPDFSKIDKVFASHLHVDHVGDFMGIHIGGWLSGRYTPIHFYGPSGSTPELGSATFVKGMKMAYAWDLQTRSGALPDAGAQIEVHEFDFKQMNKVVYEKNGVTIRSWPAIHSLDGSVSYSLEWNGLKYVFGGDTYPNKWYMEYAKDADIASHECFLPPAALAKYFGWDLAQATYVSTRIHSEPAAFGKVMATLKPRMALGYHSVQSPENNAAIMDGVRKTYDGPLTLARDLQVINVTKEQIVVRDATVDGYVLPPDVTDAYKGAPRTNPKSPGDFPTAASGTATRLLRCRRSRKLGSSIQPISSNEIPSFKAIRPRDRRVRQWLCSRHPCHGQHYAVQFCKGGRREEDVRKAPADLLSPTPSHCDLMRCASRRWGPDCRRRSRVLRHQPHGWSSSAMETLSSSTWEPARQGLPEPSPHRSLWRRPVTFRA